MEWIEEIYREWTTNGIARYVTFRHRSDGRVFYAYSSISRDATLSSEIWNMLKEYETQEKSVSGEEFSRMCMESAW